VKPGKQLDYDPHLGPQLVWLGKKEHASFQVATVSLHVHEAIASLTKSAMKNAAFVVLVVQFGTENSPCASQSEVELSCGEHPDRRCGEVNPPRRGGDPSIA
jgi:hypothetical protein